jgi:hypothetical protein
MEFKSIDDIKNFVDSKKGQEHILTLENVKQVLEHEAKRLEQYIKDELNSYFNGYTPKQYDRLHTTIASPRISTPRLRHGLEWEIDISFDESLALHNSYISSDQPKGNTAWLLNSGWRTKMDSKKPINRFTRFEGTNYLSSAIETFNRVNPYGLKVKMLLNGREISGYYSYGRPV